jgi:hypothetical protein
MDWSGFKEKLSAYAEVFRVTWPLALGMANNAVMQFVDRVFLARESTAALEAVLPASMLSLLFVGFAQTTVAYSGTFVAQYFGAGDRRGCRGETAQGLHRRFRSPGGQAGAGVPALQKNEQGGQHSKACLYTLRRHLPRTVRDGQGKGSGRI